MEKHAERLVKQLVELLVHQHADLDALAGVKMNVQQVVKLIVGPIVVMGVLALVQMDVLIAQEPVKAIAVLPVVHKPAKQIALDIVQIEIAVVIVLLAVLINVPILQIVMLVIVLAITVQAFAPMFVKDVVNAMDTVKADVQVALDVHKHVVVRVKMVAQVHALKHAVLDVTLDAQDVLLIVVENV